MIAAETPPSPRSSRNRDTAATNSDRSLAGFLWYRLVQYTFTQMLSIRGGIRATGRENIPETGGAILVSNHLSHLDVFVLGILLQRPLNYVARSTLFVPVIGPFIRSVGAFAIRREGGGSEGFRETLKRVRAGGIVTFFPEGTRSLDGTMGELKPGIVALASRAGVPVIPAAIAGTYEAWPRSRAFPRSHPVRVHYGVPIPPEDLKGLDAEAVVDLIRSRMRESQEIALAGLREIWVRLEPFGRDGFGFGLTRKAEVSISTRPSGRGVPKHAPRPFGPSHKDVGGPDGSETDAPAIESGSVRASRPGPKPSMEANAMGHRDLRRGGGLLAVVAAAALVAGAGPKKTTSPAKKELPPIKAEEVVGNIAKVPPMAEIQVEGVGLVIGLDGNGSDPAPSGYRTKLLDRMRKDNVTDAEKWLASPATSLVIIKGKIPAGVTTQDVFDVELELPFDSKTISLAGGGLLRADLHQVAFSKDGDLLPDGKVMATVSGPVLTGSERDRDNLRIGRILGGARVKTDVPFALIIDEKRRSGRTAALIQTVINSRFFRLRGIDQQGMAKAKTDQFLELQIPDNYHQNQYRFFQVVENLPVVDNPTLHEARLREWGSRLLDPTTAGAAALHLEGVGRTAADVLKTGLTSAHPQVRFFAAEALAYLDDEAGASVLADAAAQRPEFRPYALAALAAMSQAAATLRLRELMGSSDVQVRYGAFNALRTRDPGDPYLGRTRVIQDEAIEAEEGDDPTAMPIRRSRSRRQDPFSLFVVDCDGPPLVHVAQTRRCEIVIFGKGQSLLTPVVLGAGPILLNASEGDQQVHISRIGSEAVNGPDQKVPTNLALGAVVCEAANLGATYPEILSILQAAERQKNLPGGLVVDALPPALAAYDAAQVAGKDVTKKDDDLIRTKVESARPKRKTLLDRLRGGK